MPILYSYRRCPYAMRARMALKYAGIQIEHREIELRNKPRSMLQASPKGTVPVLLVEGKVIDQSLNIMHWALQQSDPDGWKGVDELLAQDWIEKNDGPFKRLLDQYKYPNRHPDLNPNEVLQSAIHLMLEPMELTLQTHPFLMGAKQTWVDIAIFPFIRQFSMVKPERFQELALPALRAWLQLHLESDLFQAVMEKHPTWLD
ncbi:glutathione S-transferase [Polynucleobacter sp. UK-Kesae-W10]|uniref:glutathione S-transferase n=1 Tax=Polynucleobacter sp. UK-Kesae-W10 TaxID=1819738 RepID=UPI0021046AFF|nr:glutathione S-transferase [Polynucleobacter sp. UK-Kesae-W10]